MGRDTLREDNRKLWEEIIKRRENDGSYWPFQFWDYTEWEEAYEEFLSKRKNNT